MLQTMQKTVVADNSRLILCVCVIVCNSIIRHLFAGFIHPLYVHDMAQFGNSIIHGCNLSKQPDL